VSRMQNFEGSLVLERLAEAGLGDKFLVAVDNDDFLEARSLMSQVGLDQELIETVIRKMRDSEE